MASIVQNMKVFKSLNVVFVFTVAVPPVCYSIYFDCAVEEFFFTLCRKVKALEKILAFSVFRAYVLVPSNTA